MAQKVAFPTSGQRVALLLIAVPLAEYQLFQ
jgi:hypothetical protein